MPRGGMDNSYLPGLNPMSPQAIMPVSGSGCAGNPIPTPRNYVIGREPKDRSLLVFNDNIISEMK